MRNLYINGKIQMANSRATELRRRVQNHLDKEATRAYARGMRLFRKGKFLEANREFSTITRECSEKLLANFRTGLCYLKLEQREHALIILQGALQQAKEEERSSMIKKIGAVLDSVPDHDD